MVSGLNILWIQAVYLTSTLSPTMHMANTQSANQNHPTPNQEFFSPEDVPHRVRDIAMLRGLGYTFREIAEQLGVTPQAVSLMLSRHRRSLKSLRGAAELSKLSARAVNALGRHNITSRDQAREKDALVILRHERNCGRKTLDEIERWLSQTDNNNHHTDSTIETRFETSQT